MDRSILTSERLDECCLTLYDLGQQDGRRISTAERAILKKARYIVNQFQLFVGKGGEKEDEREKAADPEESTAKDQKEDDME